MDSLQFDSSALGSGPSLDVDYFGVMNIDSQVDASTSESLSFSVMDAASNSDAPIDPFMWLLDGSITADKDQWLVPTNQGPMIDRPGSPIDEITQMAYQKMARFCVSPLHHILLTLATLQHMSQNTASNTSYQGLC